MAGVLANIIFVCVFFNPLLAGMMIQITIMIYDIYIYI